MEIEMHWVAFWVIWILAFLCGYIARVWQTYRIIKAWQYVAPWEQQYALWQSEHSVNQISPDHL